MQHYFNPTFDISDRKLNSALEKLRSKANDYEHKSKPISSSDEEDNDNDSKKILAESLKSLEQTQSLRMANAQLLRPEDYVRLRLNSFLLKNETVVNNVRCSRDVSIETAYRHKRKPKTIDEKGFSSYVLFVASYIVLLFIVTFLLSQIGKI